jgi:hypothetical protein
MKKSRHEMNVIWISLFAEVAPAKEAGYEDHGGTVKDPWVEKTRGPDRGHSV